jgi:putative cell wall-binding protein
VLEDGTRGAASKQTLSLLTRLGVHEVRIAGGPGAVSNGIQASLRAAGFAVTRFGGADRFATTTLINKAAFGSTARAFLSNGLDFPDALSAGPVAAAQNAPLYTANSTCVPAATLAAVGTHDPDEVVLLGGTGVLNSRVARLTAC